MCTDVRQQKTPESRYIDKKAGWQTHASGTRFQHSLTPHGACVLRRFLACSLHQPLDHLSPNLHARLGAADGADDLATVCMRASGDTEVILFVGNLALPTTEQDLRQLCAPSGTVTTVRLITDRCTGRSRGCGFVEMPESRAAQAAMAGLQSQEVAGRALHVDDARPQHPRCAPRPPRGEATLSGLLVAAGASVRFVGASRCSKSQPGGQNGVQTWLRHGARGQPQGEGTALWLVGGAARSRRTSQQAACKPSGWTGSPRMYDATRACPPGTESPAAGHVRATGGRGQGG